MSCYVIFYQNRVKMMRPVLGAGEYRSLRDSERQQRLVAAVRRGDTAMKMRLLQMNYSLAPAVPDGPGGAVPLKGCTEVSGTVGMDVDLHREDYADDEAYAKALADIPARVLGKKDELGLLMLERSVTKGYHLVFGRREGLSQEENLRWASDLLGVEFDKGAKDVTRVFFTTTGSAEDLIYLDEGLFEDPLCHTRGHLPLDGEDRLAPDDPQKDDGPQKDGDPQKDDGPQKDGDPQKDDGPQDIPSLPVQEEVPQRDGEGQEGPLYLGIPYARIIQKWWELYNDGQEPVKSNRNTLTFELAVNLRHICGFDRVVLDRVIPCYDGFPEQEKLACIDSALAERRTQMPKRLKDVLTALRTEALSHGGVTGATDGDGLVDALDNALQADELYHYDRLPRMPQGVRDSIDAAGHPLAMATLIAIAPAIGALATGVKLDVHGKARGLNICSFVVGEFASGKGQMDDIIAAWMSEVQTETDIYTQQEEEWAAKTKRMKSGKAPEQPKLPVRMLTLNNTVANIAERLSNTEGKHCYSFTPEADNVALKWKQSVSDFSVILRQAYDEARYDREAKSAEAVRVHIEKLLWNVTMCGTQDALYRVITNYTDGLLSRISIARTPDNTFAPLSDHPALMTDEQRERIGQVAHLLPLMTGAVTLPKLEERARQWLETIRLEAMKNDDRVLARQRFRGCVNAQRITCALWLPRVAEVLIRKHGMGGAEMRLKKDPTLWIDTLRRQQTDEMLCLFDLVADYLMDNDLYYFRDRIEQAYEASNYRGNAGAIRARKGKNDNIFGRLAEEFTFEQALQQSIAVKGTLATRNAVHQMLKNWRGQGLVTVTAEGRYCKLMPSCQLS